MKKWFRKNSMNLFYLPALIIMLTFLVFPLANGFRLSFLKWNGYSPKTSFVGIQNYLSMLTDKNLGTPQHPALWLRFYDSSEYSRTFGSAVRELPLQRSYRCQNVCLSADHDLQSRYGLYHLLLCAV